MDSDETLMQLFHSAPYEIREIIQRFTYKTQSKPLLKEIVDFASAKQYLQDLTFIIETSNSRDGMSETTENIHGRLWTGLNYIRHKPFKEKLLSKWKYKLEFTGAERDHENGMKNFRLLDWETSFAVEFWMSIYH